MGEKDKEPTKPGGNGNKPEDKKPDGHGGDKPMKN